MAQVWFKVMHSTLAKAEFVLPYCGFIPSENNKLEAAVKALSNIPTCVHSKKFTTGAQTWHVHKCLSISF